MRRETEREVTQRALMYTAFGEENLEVMSFPVLNNLYE